MKAASCWLYWLKPWTGRWYVATAREMNDTERRTFQRKGR
jgi:hypothetical protein